MEEKRPIFRKSVIALLVAIGACAFFIQRGDKPKTSFTQLAGTLISIENSNENYPGKGSAKFRYLQIDTYPKPFEIFIGKDAGDFKPGFEIIDKLQPGDLITIYFDENAKTRNNPVNNLVFYIDRGKEVIFIEGNSKKNLLYGIMAFCALFILLLCILKQKEKII